MSVVKVEDLVFKNNVITYVQYDKNDALVVIDIGSRTTRHSASSSSRSPSTLCTIGTKDKGSIKFIDELLLLNWRAVTRITDVHKARPGILR
ncbi:hypothetical protein [Streptomyces ortus]|uniref:Uncharacterized protein n=1 Tax=Streptomyces ortus TaxID=2867268 RepID=A0ABT3UVZ7_9ACTN|nr:hypothetical protein [Streptomyces ortus]MCX4231711.1 hypothetical protein [Streptomyces ortus]